MKSSLFLPQCPGCLCRNEWFAWREISSCAAVVLWRDFSMICSNQYTALLCSSNKAFSSRPFEKVQVVQPFNITDTTTSGKNSHLSNQKDHMAMSLLPCQ